MRKIGPEIDIYDPEKTDVLMIGAQAMIDQIRAELAGLIREATVANDGMKFEQIIRGMSTELPEIE